MFRCFPRLVAGLCVVLLAGLPGAVWAGISTSTVWEVNAAATGGDTANGGGFDPGNASMATDLAATSATGTAPVVTSASYNFITRDNATYLFIKSGTNWTAGEYPVTSTSGNAATLNAAVGAVRLYTNGAFSGLNTVAGCATVASPTGGTWSIDYSQRTAAAVTFTDLVINGATNTSFTSAANPIGKNFVGNIISVTSGTGFTVQRIQINSVSGTTGTADVSLGTLSSTGGNGGLGGALISPGKLAGLCSGNQTKFVKAGTYVFTNSQNTAGGEIAEASTGWWTGYNTTRTMTNTDGTRPLIQASVNGRTLVDVANMANFDADANTRTGCIAFQGRGYNAKILRCKATGFITAGAGFSQNWHSQTFIDCYATGCATGFQSNSGYTGWLCLGCVALGGTTGFSITGSGSSVFYCIAANQANSGFSIASGSSGCVIQNCTAYNSGSGSSGSNFIVATSQTATIRNCVAYTTTGAGTYNYAITSGSTTVLIQNCAGGNAVTGTVQLQDGTDLSLGFITLTANPFTAVSTDFSLNTTAGGGALCRAAGAPATFTGLSTTASYPDIGAVQHADPTAASSGKKAGPGGGKVGLISPPIRLRKAG
jgi:hypothetical protein